MAEKKRTFTCKVCGQEHSGLICTKFSSVRVLPSNFKVKDKTSTLLLSAPAPKPAKKAKKKKKPKKRKKPAKKSPQTSPTPTPEPANE